MSVRIVSLQARLGLDGTGFQQGLRTAGTKFSQFTAGLKGQLAGAFSAAAVTVMVKQMVNAASEIADMSKKVRLSTADFQAFQYALKQSGAEAVDLQSAIKFMARAREAALDGDPSKIAAFSDLGINEATLQAGDFAEMLKVVGDTIKGNDFGASEGPLLEKIFGKGAMEMIPVFQSGLRELADEAKRLNLIMGDDTVAKLDAVGDKIDQVSMRFKAGFGSAIGQVVDEFKEFWDWLDKFFGGIGAFIGGFQGTSGSFKERLDAARGAAKEHHSDVDKRRAAEASIGNTTTVERAAKAVTHVEDASEAAIREANGRALRALPMGPISPSEIYNKSKQGSSDRFGFASNKDLEKMTSGEVLTLQKDIARSSARMQELLEQINQRAQRTTKSGPFGSQ